MDYIYLRAWNRMLGSAPHFCTESLDRARKDKAPDDAIYERHDGAWATYDNITWDETRRLIDNFAAEIRQC